MYIVFYAVIISFWINLVKKNPLFRFPQQPGREIFAELGLFIKT